MDFRCIDNSENEHGNELTSTGQHFEPPKWAIRVVRVTKRREEEEGSATIDDVIVFNQ